MIDTLEAAHELVEAGLPITVCKPFAKVPIGKEWQHRTWTPAKIDREFARHDEPCNIGLILGKRSGIVDVEVDGAEGEKILSRLCKDVEMPICPVFQSRLGRHRFYKMSAALAALGTQNIKLGALEVRMGGHSLAPASITDSFERRWLVHFDEVDPPPLPLRVIQRIVQATHRKEHKSQQKRRKANIGVSQVRHRTRGLPLPSCVSPVKPALDLDQLISSTLPDDFGQRHHQLFAFARALKALPEYADASLDRLRPVARRWYDKAKRFIRNATEQENFEDFAESWAKVRFPLGSGPRLRELYNESIGEQLPQGINRRLASPALQELARLCCVLQRDVGEEQSFYLSARGAAGVLGCHRSAAARRLRELIKQGIIRRTFEGARRRAAEYSVCDLDHSTLAA
jgi:hypothetical protein